MDDTEIIREGREAEEILESAVFKKAFSNYKAELLDNWKALPQKITNLESLYIRLLNYCLK